MPNKLCVLVLSVVGVAAGQQSGVSARDMFYSAADLAGKKPAPAKPVDNKKEIPPAKPTSGGTKSGGGTTLQVNTPVLGLRYSILKREAAGDQYVEVSPDTVFHAHDIIRLNVMSNEKGYLYIVQQGSSGIWNPLFPDPAINAGRNFIEAGRKYDIPGGKGEGFEMDERSGEEKIFILLMREPEKDLDKIVISLRQGGQRPPAGGATPAKIDNSVIQQLREQVQSRDLVFTKTDDEDKAVYVVNTAAKSNPDSRVVVDVKLNHK